jgi:hypothetical protein
LSRFLSYFRKRLDIAHPSLSFTNTAPTIAATIS